MVNKIPEVSRLEGTGQCLFTGVEDTCNFLTSLHNCAPAEVVERLEKGDDVGRAEEADESVTEIASTVVVAGRYK